MTVLHSSAVMLALSLVAAATPPGDPPQASDLPPGGAVSKPRLVTAATRADKERLAELQRPGRILFHDDFESDESLGN